MAELTRVPLPKVRLRLRTTPADSSKEERGARAFKEYQPSPLVFQERQKMKKEIQNSYMRFRKIKTHNYRKLFSSGKKCHALGEEKKLSTVGLESRHRCCLKETDLTLEVHQNPRQSKQIKSR